MLDRMFVRENPELVAQRLLPRGFQLDRAIFESLDEKERSTRVESEELRAERNRTNDQISSLRREGTDATKEIERMKQVSARIKDLGEELEEAQSSLKDFLSRIPNLPHDSVPAGVDESANTIVREVGTPPKFDFPCRDHVDLGAALGILDLDRASKITGARFANYYGAGALLERALINFMLDLHTLQHGYREVIPPFMANRGSFYGTGNLPKFEDDLFRIADRDFFLIPTAEVPVTNIFAGEVLQGEDLPISFVAHTPCFRSEAGSYGKDTRGLIRQHQFNKVELVKFSKQEESYEQLEKLTRDAEQVLSLLGLAYRVVTLSTGDMGFSSAKTYDLEVWLPAQGTYREISSCSNYEDFQARRAGIRYRPKSGKPQLAHTLNGSALAVGRTWVAVVENFQQADGSVLIPEVLQPYMHGMTAITDQGGLKF